jgi:hypothetical protein
MLTVQFQHVQLTLSSFLMGVIMKNNLPHAQGQSQQVHLAMSSFLMGVIVKTICQENES